MIYCQRSSLTVINHEIRSMLGVPWVPRTPFRAAAGSFRKPVISGEHWGTC
jgi:hypothetical protein